MIQSITSNHLGQLKALIQGLADGQFLQSVPILEGSSVGKHVRHILEFYLCLCDALDTGELNYDNRKRDKLLETSKVKCVLMITEISAKISSYDSDFPIRLQADYSISEENGKITLNTTFFRELLYNVEHIVHHLAIIKIGITSIAPYFEIEDNIGVAASTIRNNKICAR